MIVQLAVKGSYSDAPGFWPLALSQGINLEPRVQELALSHRAQVLI